jgi:cyclic pyranopterin phosphate synthase
MPLLDTFGRPLSSLRVSVTDRCNLRCEYCMPEEEYAWLPREDILSFEEIERLVRAFVACGVTKVRLTGGEPLLRPELARLVERLAQMPEVEDLALTTNGVLLSDQARSLRSAGLRRITVSLDTLRPERFAQLSRRNFHARVLEGLRAASEAFDSLRLDCVIIRGVNDDEPGALLDHARRLNAELRLIEYMDVAGATRWTPERVVSRAEILRNLEQSRGAVRSLGREGAETAERFTLTDGTVFGIIASTTEPFCRQCDRARLSADGQWFRCLYATEGTALGSMLRSGATDNELQETIVRHWRLRVDRGAELRRSIAERRAFVPLEQLQQHPHWEMHKKGG